MFPHPRKRSYTSSRALIWAASAMLRIGIIGAVPASAWALDLTQRSISSSKQFTVYCTDAGVRSRVASFAEEEKAGVLSVLGEADHWKYPVLLVLEKAETATLGVEPVRIALIQGEAGFKVQINVMIGSDPAKVHLQKHLVRAVFLEMAYRAHPEAIEDGKPFVEAPWWLVEGTLQALRSREGGMDTDFYKQLIAINHLPPILDLLQPRPVVASDGSTEQAVDSACAVCLVQLLQEQPDGRTSLSRLVQHLPQANAGPLQALAREFPSLAQSPKDLQKWWTVNLAKLSAVDRYKGLSPEVTDAELTARLQFEVAQKDGSKRSFGVADFDQYLKLPASRGVLADAQRAMRELSANANALYKDIVAEYEQIFGALARGKAGGIKERLARVEHFRESLLRRRAEIADFMNWFEATQMAESSGQFEGYIRAANELAAPARRDDPISRYLDEISQEL